MKKVFALALALVSLWLVPSAVIADEIIKGDALVVFKTTAPSISESKLQVQAKSQSQSQSQINRADGFTLVKTYDALSALPSVAAGTRSSMNTASQQEPSGELFALVHSPAVDAGKLTTEEFLTALRARDDVIAASPNRWVYAASNTDTPNDTAWGVVSDDGTELLWGIRQTGVPEQFWSRGVTGDPDVYVAIIDSGVDYEHEDIIENFSHTHSRNFYANDSEKEANPEDYMDYFGHGTHIAGTIAATGNNELGVTGMAWKAKIIALRTLGPDGTGPVDPLIEALDYLVARIRNYDLNLAAVNLSLATPSSVPPTKENQENDTIWLAFKKFSDLNRGVLVVASGNQSMEVGVPLPETKGRFRAGDYVYPASFIGISNMLVVSAVSKDLKLADFSNYSKDRVHVAAPGVQITSTLGKARVVADGNPSYPVFELSDGTRVATLEGTSMAAPHVAGMLALLKSEYPDATGWQLRSAIVQGGAQAGVSAQADTDTSSFTRYGFLDAEKTRTWMSTNIKTWPKSFDPTDNYDPDPVAVTPTPSPSPDPAPDPAPSNPTQPNVSSSGGGGGCANTNGGVFVLTALTAFAVVISRRNRKE